MINQIAFIDFENIQKIDMSEVTGTTKLIIMVGNKQSKKAAVYSHLAIDHASSVELIKTHGEGQNALDFHIAYYLGKYIGIDNNIKYIIYSNDKGYDPLITHLKNEGIFIKRIMIIDSIKSALKEIKDEAKPLIEKKRTKRDKYKVIISSLVETFKTNKPKNIEKLRAHIKTSLGTKNTDLDVDEIYNQLIERKIITIENENNKIKYLNNEYNSAI